MDGTISQFAGIYRERAPHGALREHIRCVWANDLSQSRSEWVRVMPDGCADIVWTGRSLIVAGPDTQSILDHLPQGAVVVGVRFHPGAASPWLRLPLSEIVNSRVPLAEFWGKDEARLFDKISASGNVPEIAAAMETELRSRLFGVCLPDQQVAFLRRAAGDHCHPAGMRLDRLAARMGTSERTLRRRCMDTFGYGFKTLDRVFRFQRFFRLAAQPFDGGLSELAVRAGYADQAHMTREVRRMSGASASEVVAQAQCRADVADLFKTGWDSDL
jgi:AraC-like DNA-binding protein